MVYSIWGRAIKEYIIMSGSLRKKLAIRKYKDGDENEFINVLNKSFIRGWGTIEDWKWKYKSNKNFNPNFIFVVEDNNKIVGCLHAIIQKWRLGGSYIDVSIGSDMAILPNYRGGITSIKMIDQYLKILFEKTGTSMIVIFATGELISRFYRPVFGAFVIPRYYYMKIIDSDYFSKEIYARSVRLKKMIDNNNIQRRDFEKITLTIQFNLKNLSSFSVKIKNGEILCEDGNNYDADIIIKGTQAPLLKAIVSKSDGGNKIDFIMAVLTRKVKINGWLKNFLKIYKCYKIYTRIWNKN